jgi:hypothetical protein
MADVIPFPWRAAHPGLYLLLVDYDGRRRAGAVQSFRRARFHVVASDDVPYAARMNETLAFDGVIVHGRALAVPFLPAFVGAFEGGGMPRLLIVDNAAAGRVERLAPRVTVVGPEQTDMELLKWLGSMVPVKPTAPPQRRVVT